MKKIWILLIVIFYFSFVNANTNSFKTFGDCKQFGEKEAYIDQLSQLELKYIDEEIYSLAYDHLKSFCENVLDGDKGEAQGAYSPFLVDHLIDISFRKLDGIQEVSYLEVDSDGANWRKWLEDNIKKPTGAIPNDFYKEFKKYFDFQNVSKGLLSKKYFQICEDVKKIYSKLSPFISKLSIDTNKAYNYCLKAVNYRLNQEYQYVKYFMVYKGNQALYSNLYNYLIEQFLSNNFNGFLEKYSQMLGYFRIVVQKVIEGTSNCSSK